MIIVNNPALLRNLRKGDRPNVRNSGIRKVKNIKTHLIRKHSLQK